MFWFKEAADVGIAGRIDVDRKGRLRLLGHELEGVFHDRGECLQCLRGCGGQPVLQDQFDVACLPVLAELGLLVHRVLVCLCRVGLIERNLCVLPRLVCGLRREARRRHGRQPVLSLILLRFNLLATRRAGVQRLHLGHRCGRSKSGRLPACIRAGISSFGARFPFVESSATGNRSEFAPADLHPFGRFCCRIAWSYRACRAGQTLAAARCWLFGERERSSGCRRGCRSRWRRCRRRRLRRPWPRPEPLSERARLAPWEHSGSPGCRQEPRDFACNPRRTHHAEPAALPPCHRSPSWQRSAFRVSPRPADRRERPPASSPGPGSPHSPDPADTPTIGSRPVRSVAPRRCGGRCQLNRSFPESGLHLRLRCRSGL